MKHLGLLLRTARLSRKLSMDDLVKLSNSKISKQAISKYENGQRNPRKDKIEIIAKSLGIPIDYFYNDSQSCVVGRLEYREILDHLTMKQRAIINSIAEEEVSKYLELEQNCAEFKIFNNPIKDLLVHSVSEVEDAALFIRKAWRLGEDALPSIVRILEKKGIKVIEVDLGNIDGLCAWVDNRIPVILLNSNPEFPVERKRFTLCHELGHIVLQISNDDNNKERYCNKFAGAFLLPASACFEELGMYCKTLQLEDLIELKNAYGVSVAAWVHRAFDLNIITRETYDSIFDNVIKKNRKEIGWGGFGMEEKATRMISLERRLKSMENLI